MWFVEVLEISDTEGRGTGEFRLTASSNEGGGGPHAFVNHRHGSRSMASACPECRAYIERVTGMSLVQMPESPRKNFKVGQKWYTRGGGIASIVSVLPASHSFPIVAVHETGEQRTHRVDGKNTFDGNDSDLVSLFEGNEMTLKEAELIAAQSLIRDLQADCIAAGQKNMELQDKIDGLEADLESAVEVAYRRGAYDWVRMNHQRFYKRLAANKPSTEFSKIMKKHRRAVLRRVDEILSPFRSAGLSAHLIVVEGGDTAAKKDHKVALLSESGDIVSGYEPLAGVLREALDQAQAGKGKERHANGKAFLDQPIMEIGRMVGIGYQTGQAMKKSQEAVGMHSRGEPDRAVAEMLGAINYLAAAILAIREQPHE